MTSQLTVRQQKFIAALQTGVDGKQAAVVAGYSPKSARHAAYQLQHENKGVMAELARVRNTLAAKADYNAVQCNAALDAFIQKADARGNDSAVAKFHEQKMKLYGLLREKVDVTVERVDIAGALAAANARVLRPMCDPANAIDGKFVALPAAAADCAVDTQSIGSGFNLPMDMLT